MVGREGLDATSMRRVAEELGAAPAPLRRRRASGSPHRRARSCRPKERFPHTLALLDRLFEGGPDERFEFGLDVLVRGLASLASDS